LLRRPEKCIGECRLGCFNFLRRHVFLLRLGTVWELIDAPNEFATKGIKLVRTARHQPRHPEHEKQPIAERGREWPEDLEYLLDAPAANLDGTLELSAPKPAAAFPRRFPCEQDFLGPPATVAVQTCCKQWAP